MEARFHIPEDCCWVNYIRCHDDIGWAFADEDIAGAGFEPGVHRRFLTDFYTGRFKGSFARGLPFQENPATGDARVSGSTASLTGLEKGVEESDETEVDLAIRRNLMLHGVIMTIGGIPLIYLGDEIATLNDYSYEVDPLKRGDTRWVHRPRFDEARAEDRNQHETPQGRLFQGLSRLVQLRQQNPAFDRAETEFVDVGNDQIFGYFRSHEQHSVLVLANFTEREQAIEARRLRGLGLRKTVVDMVAGTVITATQELLLEPYQFMVLSRPV
jgi:amylosucrase/maltose alpha-D-glucosyltransferase/alpha-amylase